MLTYRCWWDAAVNTGAAILFFKLISITKSLYISFFLQFVDRRVSISNIVTGSKNKSY